MAYIISLRCLSVSAIGFPSELGYSISPGGIVLPGGRVTAISFPLLRASLNRYQCLRRHDSTLAESIERARYPRGVERQNAHERSRAARDQAVPPAIAGQVSGVLRG